MLKVMKSKFLYILTGLSVLIFGSCNKWLNIIPEDTTTEKQLFSDAGGYHSAINGLYQTMSGSQLYGENLTWGFASALSQYYDSYSSNDTKRFSFTERYEYNSDEMKNFGEQIWQTSYNVIANANNILAHLVDADPEIFPEYDKCEMDVIKGESLAIRALMHFDLLRLFAVSPKVDAKAKAIPYVDTYPSLFNERKTVEDVIARIEKDLEDAANLLAKNDTTSGYSLSSLQSASNRFNASNSSRNFFFTARGTRLNYVAVSSLLARVKSYAGDLKGAYDIAKNIVDTYVDENRWYSFTTGFSSTDTDSNRPHKLIDELLVSFYNENLSTTYTSSVNAKLINNSYSLKNLDSYFDDRNDIRFSKLVYNVDQTTPVSLKYYERSNPTVSAENKLIPIMRISELYFIMAEYLASQGDMAGAADCINEVRLARSCTNMIPADLTEAEFNNALDMEIKRENIAEGQYFFYCKKIDAATINNNGVFVNMSGKYTMNIPDSETSLN